MAFTTIMKLLAFMFLLPLSVNAVPQSTYPTSNATNSSSSSSTNQPYLLFIPYPTVSCQMSEDPFDTSQAPQYNITRETCVNGPYSFNSFVLGQPAGEVVDTSDCEVTIFQEGDCSLGMEGKSTSWNLDGLSEGSGECVIPGLNGGSVVWSCDDA